MVIRISLDNFSAELYFFVKMGEGLSPSLILIIPVNFSKVETPPLKIIVFIIRNINN